MKRNFLILGIVFILFIGCGGEKGGKKEEEVEEKSEEIVNEAQEELSSLLGEKEKKSTDSEAGEKKELVHYTKLKELLPDEVEDLPKIDEDGAKIDLGVYRHSHAKKVYRKGEKMIEITIFDYLLGGAPLQAFLEKTKMEYEDDEKIVKTYEEDGAQLWVESFKKSNEEHLGMVLDKRFVVTITTVGLEKGTAKEILKDLDLIDKLKELEED